MSSKGKKGGLSSLDDLPPRGNLPSKSVIPEWQRYGYGAPAPKPRPPVRPKKLKVGGMPPPAPAPRAPVGGFLRSAPVSALSKVGRAAVTGTSRVLSGPVGNVLTANDVYSMLKDMYDTARQYDQGAYGPMPEAPIQYARGGKVGKVMREYKAGKLHSGSKKGPLVKNQKQAVAIALSEARRAGEKVPVRKAAGGQMTPQDRRALERMRHAERYAPGMSLDMPGKRVRKK